MAGCTGTVAYISLAESLTHQTIREGWQVLRVEEHDRGALCVSVALVDCDRQPETGSLWRDDDGDVWTVQYWQQVTIDNDGTEQQGYMIYLYTVPGMADWMEEQEGEP